MLLGVKMCRNPMWEAIEVSYGCTLASVRVRKSMVKVVIGHMCVVIFVQIQCISGSNIAPQKLKTLCTSWHQHTFPNHETSWRPRGAQLSTYTTTGDNPVGTGKSLAPVG